LTPDEPVNSEPRLDYERLRKAAQASLDVWWTAPDADYSTPMGVAMSALEDALADV